MEYRFIDVLDEKKDKAAIHSLRQWLFNDKSFNDITIAKFLSSTLVHLLINVEGQEDEERQIDMAMGYHTDLIARMVSNLICGMTSPEVCRRILLKIVEDERDEKVEAGTQ